MSEVGCLDWKANYFNLLKDYYAIKKKYEQRYIIVSDDSGHDYIIPEFKREEFQDWLDWHIGTGKYVDIETDYEGIDFNMYSIRCNGLNFADPQGY